MEAQPRQNRRIVRLCSGAAGEKELVREKMFGLWEPAGLEIIRLWEDLAMFRARKRLKRWFDFKRLRNRKRVVRHRSPVVKF